MTEHYLHIMILKRTLIFIALALFLAGCNSSTPLAVLFVNPTGQPLTVEIESRDKPVTVNPTASAPSKVGSGKKIVVKGSDGAEISSFVLGEGDYALNEARSAVVLLGDSGQFLVADYSDFYTKEGEKPKENPEIKIYGKMDGKFMTVDNSSAIQFAGPGFLPDRASIGKPVRVVPVPEGLAESEWQGYLQKEMQLMLQNKKLGEGQDYFNSHNRYRRFMPGVAWLPASDALKKGDQVSITIFNASPSPILFRKNENKVGVVIPKASTYRWLSANRKDKVSLLHSTGDGRDVSGAVLREFQVADVVPQDQEHVLLVNDPGKKFEFLLADFTTLATGQKPSVGEVVRANDDIAVLEPYDLVWGLEKQMPPMPQEPGRVMRMMVIKPEIPPAKFKMWAEAGLRYDIKNIKAGVYK